MNDKNHYNQYFEYLKKRSLKSFLYRKYYIYPKYKKYINGSLLDVGCGIGEILSYYKNSIGVDINSECVNYCKSKGLNAKIMKVDNLPFEDNKFNTVMLDNVLEHIDNPNKMIVEINRVMKNESHLLVSVPGIKGFIHDPDHKVFYDQKKLNQIFEANKFKLVKNFYTPFKSDFLDKKARQYCLHGIFLKK